MIHYKSADEIDKMRKAGRILAETVDRVMEARRARASTTADLDAVAVEHIARRRRNASFMGYRGIPGVDLRLVNSEIVHGIPSPKRVLQEGDILSLDFGAIWEGFHVGLGGDGVRRASRPRPRPRSS